MNKSLLSTTRNTRVVIPGLWRSDAILSITPEDKKFLLHNGVTEIIDMRGSLVADAKPCALRYDNDFHYNNIPIDFAEARGDTDLIDWPETYREILHHLNLIGVLNIISSCKDTVIINCTAGKDRTGVIAMIVEYVLDVPRDTIVSNYLASIDYLGSWFEDYAKKHGGKPDSNKPTLELANIILNNNLLPKIKSSTLGGRLREKFNMHIQDMY